MKYTVEQMGNDNGPFTIEIYDPLFKRQYRLSYPEITGAIEMAQLIDSHKCDIVSVVDHDGNEIIWRDEK